MLLVLKEMLPTYHKWRYNTYGVRERIGKGSRLMTSFLFFADWKVKKNLNQHTLSLQVVSSWS